MPDSDILIGLMESRKTVASTRCPSPRPAVDRSDWVETTSIAPRQRPKAGMTHSLPVQQSQTFSQPPSMTHTHSRSPLPANGRQQAGGPIACANIIDVSEPVHLVSNSRSYHMPARPPVEPLAQQPTQQPAQRPAAAPAQCVGVTSPFDDDFSQYFPKPSIRVEDLTDGRSGGYGAARTSFGFDDSFQPTQVCY